MIRETRNRDQIYHSGERANSARKAVTKKGRKPPRVIDPEALQAAKDALSQGVQPSRGLPVTGRCYDCDRAVSGERRYCGPCLAKRM